jgi:choline dehydrogenase-like flavoprotein
VADASLFPTAIGVNPQITIMALATRVAQRLQLARRAA